LSWVKTMPSSLDGLREAGHRVITQAHALLSKGTIESSLAQRFDDHTKAFVDYWFLPTTQCERMALVLAIESVTDPSARRFLALTFSSIIITKSGGVSRARDLAHSRPHLDKTKVPKNALVQFALRLQKNLTSIARLKMYGTVAGPLAGDARLMPFGCCPGTDGFFTV